jgi:hypothetical protein
LVLQSSEGCREGGEVMGITAVRVVLKEIALVAEFLLHFSLLVSVLISLLLEVRFEAQV